MRWLADRSPRDGAIAIAATCLAFALALCLALPQPLQVGGALLGAAIGAVLIVAAFPAVSRVRPLAARPADQRTRLAALSLLAGAALGAVLVGALVPISRLEPAVRARFTGRADEPPWRPMALAVESSILEEVVFRLFLFGVAAWAAERLLRRFAGNRWSEARRRTWAVAIGVLLSTALFSAAHLPAWLAATKGSVLLVAVVMLLNGVGALLLAWIFWRCGLPYAMLAHFAGDLVVQLAGPRLLG
jgi:MFS family permease